MTGLLDNAFQQGYVTNDLEQAAALFAQRFRTGAFTFHTFDGVMRIALAFAGKTMIELIEPITDPAGLYDHWIDRSGGFAVRHHHIGMLVDSQEQMGTIRAAHVADGTAVAAEGAMPGALDFLYVDTSRQLGHYLEYVWLDAGGRAMFGQVEGSIFA